LLYLVNESERFARKIGYELKAAVRDLALPIGTVNVACGVFSSRHGLSLRSLT
jgi:hypothetical protein